MELDTQDQLETKAGIPQDVVVTHSEMMRAFALFKESNDERLATIERRGSDPLLDEKVDRINTDLTRRLDEINLKHARPALDRNDRAGAAAAFSQREHKSAFDEYMREGESAGLRALEVKAMSVGSNPDGGYVVPLEIEQAIGE